MGAACAVSVGTTGPGNVGDLAVAALGVATAAVLWTAGRTRQTGWRGWRLFALAPLVPVLGLVTVVLAPPRDPVQEVALRWLTTVPGYVLAVVGILTLVTPARLRGGTR